MSALPPITLERVRDEWKACYDADRLAALYPVPRTPREVLTLTDGPWAAVPPDDRIWTLTRPGVLPDPVLRLFAVHCARRVLLPDADPRSLAAIECAERHAYGLATDRELADAADAARAAFHAALADADAAWAAAWAAARAAARDAAWAAANTARAAADALQLSDLLTLIDHWEAHGCLPPRKEPAHA